MNQGDMISQAVRQYMSKNKVKIIIGTPCFGGLLHNGFFQSTLDLSVNFTKLNIPFEVMTIGNESLIQRARNGIVARFMGDDTATHLMFIDADITYSWISIIKLLLSGKELCGGCYPKKCFNWDKIKHHNQKNPGLKDDELMAKSLDYVFNPIYHKEGDNVVIKLDNGMAQVKDIGTGFMLIKKSVITKMFEKYPETKFRNNVAGYGQNKADDCFYCLFDCAIEPVSRVYLSEDYLFCKRWIDIGGELWLDLNTNLNHTGLIDYKGCLSVTIGEVDTLNKDAQIMKKQSDKEELDKEMQQKKEAIMKNIEEYKAKQTTDPISTNPTTKPTTNPTTNPVATPATNPNKKKKKKNKNKNTTKLSTDNTCEESSDDEEEIKDNDKKDNDKKDNDKKDNDNNNKELLEKIKEIPHC